MVGEEHQPWPEVNYFNSVLLTFSESKRPFGRAEQDDSSMLGLKQSARRRSWCSSPMQARSVYAHFS